MSVRRAFRSLSTVAVLLAVVLAPAVGTVPVAAASSSGSVAGGTPAIDTIASQSDNETSENGTSENGTADAVNVLARSRSDGTVYQTGRVVTIPGRIDPGDTVSVTGRIEAEIERAENNLVYAVLGLSDGTVIDVQRMDGTGSGNVTTEGTIPEDASWNETVAWTFVPVVDSDRAVERFKTFANAPTFPSGENGVPVGPVGGRLIDSNTTTEVDAPIERTFDNGTLRRFGRLDDSPGSLEANRPVSVTGSVRAVHPSAEDGSVYGVLGTTNGTVIGTERMDGTGNGTVTVSGTVPTTAVSERIVWTFFEVGTAADAHEEFRDLSAEGVLVGTDETATVGAVNATGAVNGSLVAEFGADPISSWATFDAAPSTTNGTIETYEWSFGDGTNATGETVVHTYESPGTYDVTLTVTDDRGRVNTTTETVQLTGEWQSEQSGPTNLTITGSESAALSVGSCGIVSLWKRYGDHTGPVSVSFDYTYDVAGPPPELRIWGSSGDFEIGTGGSGSGTFERTVEADGGVKVNVFLKDPGGDCADEPGESTLTLSNFEVTLSNSSGVTENPPNAVFTPSETEPGTGASTTFDAIASVDNGSIETYKWDFGDGTITSGRTVTHSYDTPGRYLVELTVTDDQGLTDTTEQWIDVSDDPNEADGSGENDSAAPADLRSISYGETATGFVDRGDPTNETYLGGVNYEPVQFSARAGDIVSVGVESEESAAVRLWGPDGTIVASQAVSNYELPANGTYTIEVALWAVDTGAYDLSLTRHNDDVPRAAFDLEADDPGSGEELNFTASVSTSGSIDAYEWAFGDGASATGAEVTHTYETAGTYEVTLTVTDDEGLTDTVTKEFDVEGPLEQHYDTDDDGLEFSELQNALDDLVAGAAPGDTGSEVSVSDVRELLNEQDDGSDNETAKDSDEDGLPDELEKRGIPVLRTYEFSEVGEDANLTEPLESDADGIKRLKTDPYDADTDGDGILDGEEVGERKTIPGPINQTYYELKSDPTDPNTDDTGANDSAERRMGSDPREPEHFSVSAVVPVVGQENCDPGSGVDAKSCAKVVYGDQDAGAFGVKPESEHNYQDTEGFGDPPNWLGSIEDELVDGRTYYLLPVQVETSTSGDHPEDLPSYLRFTGFDGSGKIVGSGPSPGEISDTDGFDPFADGDGESKTFYVVFSTTGGRPGGDANYQRVGELRMELKVPTGPYARGDPSGDHQWETVTTGHSLGVKNTLPDTSEDEARAMVEEASKKFGQNAVGAAVPVTGGALGAANLRILTDAATGAMVVAEGTTMLSGISDRTYAADDLIGKYVVGEGTVPAYIDEAGHSTPTANTAIVVYRAN